jgi:redox-sensing transcriptional repressor
MEAAVSEATVQRLPAYLRVLVDLAADGVPNVASDRLAGLAGVHPATLRRDLSSLGFKGTRGVGYDVKYLVFEISVILGLNQEWPVVIVGAGNLGRALANYRGLSSRGFPVRLIVDVNPDLVGNEIGGVEVHHIDELAHLVEERGITVGVVATSAESAGEVADLLVAAGITSILNFTAEPLDVPSEVVVRRVDLATELQILSFYKRRDGAVTRGTGLPLGPA